MDSKRKSELRAQSLDRVRTEILAERAAALGRITQTLERHLETLRHLREASDGLEGADRCRLKKSRRDWRSSFRKTARPKRLPKDYGAVQPPYSFALRKIES